MTADDDYADDLRDWYAEDDLDGADVAMVALCDVAPERVRWLWPGWLPVGKLVVLDGDPDVGKSTLSDEFAAVVSTGGCWPDGAVCPVGNVVLLSAEDGIADTIRPRLDAAGADVTRVHAIQGVPTVDDDGNRALRPPTLADIAALASAIRQTNALLMVVDVLMAYVPVGVDSYKDSDIRAVLVRLAALAEHTGCTVLLLRHLNKSPGRNPLYRGGGSIGIVGAARAGLLAAYDPDDADQRVLAVVKSNLAPTPKSLGYQLVGAGMYGAARVRWTGETGHTARSLLDDPDEPGAATEAQRWLHDYMVQQGGSAKSKDAKHDAAKAGIAERTLKRAAKTLKLAVESHGFPRETIWSYPASQVTPPRSQNVGPTGPTRDEQPKPGDPEPQSGQSGQNCATGPTECTACSDELTRDNWTGTDMCVDCVLTANNEDDL